MHAPGAGLQTLEVWGNIEKMVEFRWSSIYRSMLWRQPCNGPVESDLEHLLVSGYQPWYTFGPKAKFAHRRVCVKTPLKHRINTPGGVVTPTVLTPGELLKHLPLAPAEVLKR